MTKPKHQLWHVTCQCLAQSYLWEMKPAICKRKRRIPNDVRLRFNLVRFNPTVSGCFSFFFLTEYFTPTVNTDTTELMTMVLREEEAASVAWRWYNDANRWVTENLRPACVRILRETEGTKQGRAPENTGVMPLNTQTPALTRQKVKQWL